MNFCDPKSLEFLQREKLSIMQQSSAFYTVVRSHKLGDVDNELYLTYLYRLGHLCAKNCQIWWRFDLVLTKTSLVIFWHTLYNYAIPYTTDNALFLAFFISLCSASFSCMCTQHGSRI